VGQVKGMSKRDFERAWLERIDQLELDLKCLKAGVEPEKEKKNGE